MVRLDVLVLDLKCGLTAAPRRCWPNECRSNRRDPAGRGVHRHIVHDEVESELCGRMQEREKRMPRYIGNWKERS
jgi:hypothetical protein